MRKFLLTALAVIYTLATLLLAFVSFITITNLRQENADLKDQIASLQESVSQPVPTVAVPQTILVDVPNSYCNLIVDHWEADQSNLNIVTAYAQAIITSNAPSATADRARLVLKLNDQELSTAEITLNPGESSESLEADVKNISFSIPNLSTSDELSLWLEVILPGNITINCYGASWYRDGDMLYLISG